MKRSSALVLAGLAFTALPLSSSSSTQARPLCVQYNDPIHLGSYQYCPLGASTQTVVAAPPVPTTVCAVTELLGVEYVKDCEGGPVS